MADNIKDDQGYNQIFKKTRASIARNKKRCLKIINRAEITKSDKLLELGCGLGDYASFISEQTGAEIIGVDIYDKFIEQANREFNNGKVKFIVADACNLPFPENSFSIVYGNGILHHLIKEERVFQEIKRVLKPGGKIVFIEPNLYNPYIFLIFKTFFRKWAKLDPEEMAFTKSFIVKKLIDNNFDKAISYPIDFILPIIPDYLLKINIIINDLLEKLPLLKELSQSILIYGEKK